MTAFALTPLTSDLGPPESIGSTITRNGLTLSTKWMSASVVRITAAGDVDASNAGDFARYVFRHAANSRRLILDLQNVDFFSTAGFASLMNIEAGCSRAAVNWTVVSNRAVSRVLEICDPRRTLPVAKA